MCQYNHFVHFQTRSPILFLNYSVMPSQPPVGPRLDHLYLQTTEHNRFLHTSFIDIVCPRCPVHSGDEVRLRGNSDRKPWSF
jgi:hypothetical protein